jgi:translation initiation factor 2B subunit (eIF-2B alpha/beta/delta family)
MTETERERIHELLLYHSQVIGSARLTRLALESLRQAIVELKFSPEELERQILDLVVEVRQAVRDARPRPVPLVHLLRSFEAELQESLEKRSFSDLRGKAVELLNEKIARYEAKREAVTRHGLDHLADGETIIVHSASSVVTNILLEAHEKLGRIFMVYVLQLDPVRTPLVTRALEGAGIPHLVVPVHDLCHYQDQIDKIFIGALTITPDRKMVAPLGTANVLSICHLSGIRSYLFANTLHYSTGTGLSQRIDRTSMEVEEPEAQFSVTSHSHDLVELSLIDVIVNEHGILDLEELDPEAEPGPASPS